MKEDATGSVDPAGSKGESGRSARDRALDQLLFLPRLVILIGKLVADPGVSKGDKAILGVALAYVASPIDLIPDFVPVIGQLDDLYLVALVLLRLINRAGPEKVREHWDGPEDIVAMLEKVTQVTTAILPEKVRRLVLGRIESAEQGQPGS